MSVKLITNNAMNKQALTQQGFADALNESLVETGVSRVSVSYWLNGKTEPETDFLEAMLVAYDPGDWRFSFALECLAAKSPLVWADGGVVWQMKLPKRVGSCVPNIVNEVIKTDY